MPPAQAALPWQPSHTKEAGCCVCVPSNPARGLGHPQRTQQCSPESSTFQKDREACRGQQPPGPHGCCSLELGVTAPSEPPDLQQPHCHLLERAYEL